MGQNDDKVSISGIFPNAVKGDFTLLIDSKLATIGCEMRILMC
jgi:hypothetical protein